MAKKKKIKAKAKKVVRRPKAKRTPVKKSKAKRAPAKAAKKNAKKAIELSLEKMGEVSHFFPHVKAAAVKIIKDGLKVGDEIYIKGHTTDFKEKIKSMQLDHVAMQEAKTGQEIGLLVKSRVRIGDSVYKI